MKKDQVTKEQLEEFGGFCANIGKPDLQAKNCKACKTGKTYPTGMFRHCEIQAKAVAKEEKKVIKISSRLKAVYADFEEFKSHLNTAPKVTLGMELNSLLLSYNSIPKLLEKVTVIRKAEYKSNMHFQNIGHVRKHIQWLADRGFQFSFNKSQIKLTGYAAGTSSRVEFPKVKKVIEKEAA